MRPASLPAILHRPKTRPTLAELQALVGGYIELVRVPGRPDVQMFANEEGMRLSMDRNEEASRLARKEIIGPAVLLEGAARVE